MLYLITGGAGFIGSNILEKILKNGERVRVLDNFITGRRENIENIIEKYGYDDYIWIKPHDRFIDDRRIVIIEGDIRDKDICIKASRGVDYILHQAAIGSTVRSIEDPFLTNDCNINGTLNILMAAKDNKVKRLICAGSSSIYGNSEELPRIEDGSVSPISPYAVTKYTQENYCKVFTHIYGLSTVVLRYFNVYGPRQDPNSRYSAVIPIFIKKLLNNEKPVIFGDGEQTRDFTFVEDVVNANLKGCEADNIIHNTFNISSGRGIKINEIYSKIRSLLESNIEPIYSNPRAGDVRDSFADISRAKSILGYEPEYDIDLGLKKAIDWYVKNL